jgi:hypothetical protein
MLPASVSHFQGRQRLDGAPLHAASGWNKWDKSCVSVGFSGGRAMRQRTEGPFLLKLAGHLAMGASLGTGLALALIMMDTGRIFEMIVSSVQPGITTLVFVGVLGSICAVGATITGLIFMLAEDAEN